MTDLFSKRFAAGALLLIALLAAIPALSQVPKPDFNRVRTIDVENYTIRTSFDRRKKTVNGDTTVTFRPLSDEFRTLELDAVGLRFENVEIVPGGGSLDFRTTPNSVIVTLDRPRGKGEKISVRFKYSANPAKGVYFVDSKRDGSKLIRDAQIWTQGEPEETRYWIPSYDFPDDKATTEQFITVDRGETAIANGELVGVNESGRQTTFHFKMAQPHSIYLTSFVVGKYVKITGRYKDIPLAFYVYPGKESAARDVLAKTPEMMRIYEELTGIGYPYNKYDQIVVADFKFGGMENITATTLSDDDVFLIEQPGERTSSRIWFLTNSLIRGSGIFSPAGIGPNSGSTRASRPLWRPPTVRRNTAGRIICARSGKTPTSTLPKTHGSNEREAFSINSRNRTIRFSMRSRIKKAARFSTLCANTSATRSSGNPSKPISSAINGRMSKPRT
ncbi:MAG: hypothetical protein IPK58_13675 [Acidobacteria bacterium]|nr:hypothetical protein [Acidobacteriota bacterium]